jgi:hypothetical protein
MRSDHGERKCRPPEIATGIQRHVSITLRLFQLLHNLIDAKARWLWRGGNFLNVFARRMSALCHWRTSQQFRAVSALLPESGHVITH